MICNCVQRVKDSRTILTTSSMLCSGAQGCGVYAKGYIVLKEHLNAALLASALMPLLGARDQSPVLRKYDQMRKLVALQPPPDTLVIQQNSGRLV